MIASEKLWLVFIGLGLGSFLLRYSFHGIIGDRELPAWVLRHLRYTGSAVLPALIAPLIFWPAANGGAPEPARLFAAFCALAIGYWLKSPIAGILSGGIALAFGLGMKALV